MTQPDKPTLLNLLTICEAAIRELRRQRGAAADELLQRMERRRAELVEALAKQDAA